MNYKQIKIFNVIAKKNIMNTNFSNKNIQVNFLKDIRKYIILSNNYLQRSRMIQYYNLEV